MEEEFDIRGIKTIWALFIIVVLLIGAWVLAKNQNMEIANYLLVSGIVFFAVVWILTFVDIKNNTVYNKPFWVVSMFVMPHIIIFVYLVRRNKLIRYGSKHGYN